MTQPGAADMARTREQMKGRSSKTRGFSMFVHAYFQSQEYAELSSRAVKALVDLYCQYRGGNNGDLCGAWAIMSKLGWTSRSQLGKALYELLAKGWITVTRQGGRRVSTLYAVSFLGIDPCGSKLDVPYCPTPSHLWKRDNRAPIIEILRSGRKVRKKVVSLDTGQCDPRHGLMERAANAQ